MTAYAMHVRPDLTCICLTTAGREQDREGGVHYCEQTEVTKVTAQGVDTQK